MSTLLLGKPVSDRIRAEVRAEIQRLAPQAPCPPGLAVILVGHDPASAVYVRNKQRACEKVGIHSVSRLLPEMRDFDPRIAYDGGSDGLAFFRRIADDFDAITKVGGVGIFQVSDASAVTRIMRRRGFSDVHIHDNYVGIPTAVAVKRP